MLQARCKTTLRLATLQLCHLCFYFTINLVTTQGAIVYHWLRSSVTLRATGALPTDGGSGLSGLWLEAICFAPLQTSSRKKMFEWVGERIFGLRRFPNKKYSNEIAWVIAKSFGIGLFIFCNGLKRTETTTMVPAWGDPLSGREFSESHLRWG